MSLLDRYAGHGEFCVGTVATMNSKNTIVAYIEADTPYYPCRRGAFSAETWSNKKYRELIIVDPLIISTIRSYPRSNADISMAILDKVQELCFSSMGWYYKSTINYDMDRKTIKELPILLVTYHMYNDAECHKAYYIQGREINTDITPTTAVWNEDKSFYTLRYDGIAKCLGCHEDVHDSHYPYCHSCNGDVRCTCCNNIVSELDAYYIDGEFYCNDCYSDIFQCCDSCLDTVVRSESSAGKIINTFIYLLHKPKNEDDRIISYASLFFCEDCLRQAIDDGYAAWYNDVIHNTPYMKWEESHFYLTSKALNDKAFMNRMPIYTNSSFTPIGIDEYLAKE